MIAPDASVLDRLMAAAAGSLRMVTLAPELDGALALIAPLRRQGVIVAMGHSDAGYEEAAVAIRAGANHATHLFNAMPSLHHRAPGLVGAALEADISCELINDGRHVHPAVVGLVAQADLLPRARDRRDRAPAVSATARSCSAARRCASTRARRVSRAPSPSPAAR